MLQTTTRTDTLAHQLALVSEISSRVTGILQLDDLLQTVADLTKAQFNLYHAHIYLIDGEREYLTLAAGAGDIGRLLVNRGHQILTTHPHSLVARASREMQPVIVNDVTQVTDFLPNPMLPDTQSEMAVPLVFANQTLGVLDVQADTIGQFDESTAYIYSLLANQIAVAIQNAQSFRQLHERESELLAATKLANDMRYALDQSAIVAITDQRGIIEYVNDKFCEISKYTREELMGQDHRIINSGYHSKDFMRNLWVTIANGRTFRAEIKNRAKDGSYYWVDTTIVPFLNNDGKPRQYLAIRREITANKYIEEETIRRANELQAVAQIAQTIGLLINDQHELLQAVAD